MAPKSKPKAAATPGQARVTGGFGKYVNQYVQTTNGGQVNIPGFPITSSSIPQSTVNSTSSRLYKGGTAEVNLTQTGAVQAEGNAVAQQLIGKNLTPDQVAQITAIINAQEYQKGAADIATAQAQQEAYIEAITGGSAGIAAATGNSGAGSGPNGNPTPQQVYNQVLSYGGSVTQAEVAAALITGPETNYQGSANIATELAGGVGPAAGLFQFEPGTWTGSAGGGKNGLPTNVAQATWQQQVQGFVNATRGDHFKPWGPDLVTNPGNPNDPNNPNYGYSGPPQAGSKVANAIASLGPSLKAGVPTPQPTGTSAAGVVSPVGPGLIQGRTDQGVDFSGSGPLFAVGSGEILSITNAGWPGKSFIALKLDNPPDPQHSVVYYAEDITPQVKVGQKVTAGTRIGTATGGSSGVEIGWGDPKKIGQALAAGTYKEGSPTTAGEDFVNYIKGSGGNAGLAGLTPQQGAALKEAAAKGGGPFLRTAQAAQQAAQGAGANTVGGITQNPIPTITPLAPGQTAGSETVGQNTPFQIGSTTQFVEAPTATIVQTPLTASEATASTLMNQYSNQYQEQNLVNVFSTIAQMLGAPKQGLTSPLPVP